MKRPCWLQLAFILWGTLAFQVAANDEEQTCSSGTSALYNDPNLKAMTVNLGDGTSGKDSELTTFYAYVSPDIATFYNKTAGSVRAVEPSFRGQFGKFINLSNKKIQVYWQPTSGKNRQATYISDVAPFGGAGTATYPGHVFLVVDPTTQKVDPANALETWTMKKGHTLYAYDPYGSLEEASKVLAEPELELYRLQWNNLAFNSVYKRCTNREWLALYGRKHRPRLPMWPADYFGQTHTFTTKESRFKNIPPKEKWNKIPWYSMPDEEREYLQEHRELVDESAATVNMTMTVISASPRVFEIKNFLSEEECHHILELATGMKLSRSTTRAGSVASFRTDDDTRTSQNSWISRQQSPIIDSIYRRAADWLQIDEAFLRYRKGNETQLVPESTEPISERLQLVHYAPGQQYTPHHVSYRKYLLLQQLRYLDFCALANI